MSIQTGFFDSPIESEPEPEPEQTIRREKGDVTRRSLPRSIVDCHRIEDEVWRRLRAADCSEQSDAVTIRAVLLPEYASPPQWCELAAWQRICRSFRDWAHIFGNLELGDATNEHSYHHRYPVRSALRPAARAARP